MRSRWTFFRPIIRNVAVWGGMLVILFTGLSFLAFFYGVAMGRYITAWQIGSLLLTNLLFLALGIGLYKAGKALDLRW